MTASKITNHDDIIDLRDVIALVEDLRDMASPESYEGEHKALEALLKECKGNGGDEQWEGAWYPVTLIRDSYFTTYAQELADDCGMIPDGSSWPCTCIDWDKAARELRMDYTSVEFDGETYWTR